MTLTHEELKEKLAQQFDELTLCDLLRITPQDLVDAFEDRVEAYYTRLLKEIE